MTDRVKCQWAWNWVVISADRYARVAELVDARDLKSLDQKSCGFDSRLAHQIAGDGSWFRAIFITQKPNHKQNVCGIMKGLA